MAFLKKRGDIWYGVYYLSGKLKWKPLSPNKKEATDKLIDIENEISSIKYGHKIVEKSWPGFLEEYLSYSKTNKKKSTAKFDSYILTVFNQDNYLKSIQELTPKLLENWKSRLSSRSLKPSTINRYIGLLKAIGQRAYEWGYISDNRYSTVKQIPITEQEQFYYSKDNIITILKSCNNDFERVLIHIAFYSGLRRTEIQNLRWDAIDFENNIITVRPVGEWSPKSYKPRHVALNKILKNVLIKWKRKSPGEYVLPTTLSNIWILSKIFKKILERAKLDGSIHDARHSFITHLAGIGEDPLILQREAGHSDFKTTNKIYTHLNIKKFKTKIDQLNYQNL